jgi:molecular chaperone DnaK (HSP70)
VVAVWPICVDHSGTNNPNYGRKHSEETKKKIGKVHKGKKVSEETRKKMSKAHKGKKLSEEARKKISEANKGRKPSEEARKKIGKASSVRMNAYWQAQTEEYKKKTSQMLNAAKRKKHREMKEQENV